MSRKSLSSGPGDDAQATSDAATIDGQLGSGWARPGKISERVAKQLVDHILAAGLRPGTRLPTESELIGILGVGRGSLREALRLLESRGVISIKQGPRGGPIVRGPKARDLGDELRLLLEFEGASLDDVMAAREVLEPALARRAATKITDEQLAVLVDSCNVVMSSLSDHTNFRQENTRFHTAVAEAGGGLIPRIFCETLMVVTETELRELPYNDRRREMLGRAHIEITDAIAAGDGATAERLMLQHIQSARVYWAKERLHVSTRQVRWSDSRRSHDGRETDG